VKRLCATVLLMEAIVIALAIPVAVQIAHVHGRTAFIVGGAIAASAAVLAGLASVSVRLTLAGGTVLQLLVIAAGAVVPAMYALGVIFAGLWATGIWLARRIERTS
jgi:Protein of unknown function (DUF4233)